MRIGIDPALRSADLCAAHGALDAQADALAEGDKACLLAPLAAGHRRYPAAAAEAREHGLQSEQLYGEHDDGSVSRIIRVVRGPEAVLDTVVSVVVVYAWKRSTLPPPSTSDTLRFEARVHPLSWFPVAGVYQGPSGAQHTFYTNRVHGRDRLGAVNCVLYADTALVECW